ncbi:MAG: DNA-processing protein DprA [Alphaproteobacteria bacterium]|nr:DNA-processing protein DprA [Alphaproteobacteria bacterium]
MTDSILLDILQLIRTDGIGPVTFYEYVRRAGNVKKALELAGRKKSVYPRELAETELATAQEKNVKIIAYCDEIYPKRLLELNDAPPIIYALGNIDLLKYTQAIAIVGARNASIAGRKMASHLAYDLTLNQVMVISGMARGIDSASHKGALFANEQKGVTIAVVGTGVDEVYPKENEELYRQICKQGLIISEFAMGTKAQISNFPRRNRIISALSDGVVVVEAGLHSGSLITARLALEQGKEVFAVPGSPTENRAAGSNQLIKEGAVLTESSADILNVLSMQSARHIKKLKIAELPLDKPQNNVNISNRNSTNITPEMEECNLLNFISYEGVDIDELLRVCGLSQAEFFVQLTELEFLGKIERQVGNKVAKIK